MIEVTYQLEREDYWQYNTFVIGRIPALKRQTVFSLLFFPAILTFDLWIFHVGGNSGWLILLGAAVCIVWGAFFLWSRKRTYLRTVTAKPGSLGLHSFALCVTGLCEQASVMEVRVKWPGVTEITECKNLLVFFISPRFGFIVPKRAFPTPEQAQLFLETARAYRQSAIDGTPPLLPSIPQSWPPAPSRITQGKL